MSSDKNNFLEAGWATLRIQFVPPEAPDYQVDDMRAAYYAGVKWLIAGMRNCASAEEVSTLLGSVDLELAKFLSEYKQKHGIEEEPKH